MSHWIIAPVVLPALTAPFLLLATGHDLRLQRTLSVGATGALVLIALGLFAWAADGQPRAYHLGDWPAPFGIILVLDRLSALMVLLTSILAFLVVLYAAGGCDKAGRHFHPLFQFQLMGLNGAFLTGDVFNLFVFFEVLLIASYGLMLHGGGARRFQAGIHYIGINLIGSTLFLFGVGLIYAATGTLNMADLAVKVPLVDPDNLALLRTGALLLLGVFAIKAALVPLFVWLPATYSSATPPVAALFAIMTKVGAYAILRVYTLCFGGEAGAAAWIAAPWVLPAALVTLVIGTAGILASRDLRILASFAVVASMGTLLIGIGLFTPQALAAALYYLVHSTLIAAILFLLADLVARRRGLFADWIDRVSPEFSQGQLLAGMFFLAAIAIAGMPPLSGFIGKLLILQAARDSAIWQWIWVIVLSTSLLVIVGFARAGSAIFWKSTEARGQRLPRPEGRMTALPIAAACGFLGLNILLTAFAGPAMGYFDAVAGQLMVPSEYIAAVLGPDVLAQVGR